MKAVLASSSPLRAIALSAVLLLGGCAREDEELQRQLVEMRAALAAKTKALEQAESRPAPSEPSPAPAAPSAALTEELAKARTRIAELESQLAAPKPETPVAAAPAKLDFDALKDKLESDLSAKAKTLREVLLKQAGVSRIDEIGIRGIEYPPEIIAPFRSAITFALSANDGRQLRMVFPVTADLDGRWSLPGPDKVQQAFKQVRDAPATEPAVAGNPGEPAAPSPPSTTANSVPGAGAGLSPRNGAPPPQPAGTGFRQLDANTFQFDWGDGSKGGRPTTPAPSQSPAPAAPVASVPQPAPAQPARPQPPAAQPEPAVPKPVMPVQRDIIIKF